MNTPNKLTIARMIIVPFLVIFLLTGWGGEANRYISLTLFVVASVTDWFDGYLARKNNLLQTLVNLWILWRINCLYVLQ